MKQRQDSGVTVRVLHLGRNGSTCLYCRFMLEVLQQVIGQPCCRPVLFSGPQPATADVLRALAGLPHLVALESLRGDPSHGRYSIFVSDPVQVLVCTESGPNPFDVLGEWAQGCHLSTDQVPFFGGWVGYIGYEAGRFLERLPGRAQRDLPLAVAWLGLYDTAVIFDHASGRWSLAGVEFRGPVAVRPALSERLDALERILRSCTDTVDDPPPRPHRSECVLAFDRQAYVKKVERILEHIRRGDIYQANLTERFEVPRLDMPLEAYRRMRQTNRGDYAAFLSCGGYSILCTSPELFLSVAHGQVLTRPIKGTVPRVDDPDVDRRRAQQLLHSEKDLAELAMIVDLERNDLGRVCTDIQAEWPPMLQSFDTVHHLMTNVRGTLQPHASAIDVLRACFPGGSITGCPKIRAMEIIDDLEAVARGPYCGAIGYLGLDGALHMNIAIRTVVTVGEKAYVHAGGGIVADSDPETEYTEMIAKAKGMLIALGVHPNTMLWTARANPERPQSGQRTFQP